MPSATAQRVVENAPRRVRPPTPPPPPAQPRSGIWRYLPHALVVTFATVVLPLVVVELAQEVTGRSSLLLSVALAIALSAGAASAGAALWQRRRSSQDVLFGDLMLWGFVRRVRAERRLAEASRLLGYEAIIGDGAGSNREWKIEVLERLAQALDSRDPFMLGHSHRVARSAQMIASRMGLPAEQVAKIRVAAAVHDVGKIKTPSSILNKPGALTDAEFEVIKRHPGDGARMLDPLGDPEIAAMVRHHHERLDGSGYPDGLSGSGIPIGARIIAVADTFDAITSARPYRPTRKQQAALRILKEEARNRLDPQAVAVFLSYYAGRRTAAWSSLALAIPERLIGLLTGGAGPLGQGAAATVAAVGLGGALINPTLHTDPPPAKVASSPHVLVTPGAEDRAAAPPGLSTVSPKPKKKARTRSGAGKEPASGGSGGSNEAPAAQTGTGPSSGSSPAGGGPGSSDSGGGGSGGSGGGASGADLPALIDSILGSGGGETPALPALPQPPAPPAVPGAPKL